MDSNISKSYADLSANFPDMKGLSIRNVKYMRAFSEAYPDISFLQAPLAQISWYHHITLLDKVKDAGARMFYIQKAVENGWSRNIMVYQYIKTPNRNLRIVR